jgi:hypothetical protein
MAKAFSLTIDPATVLSDGNSYADYIYDLHLHLNSQEIHIQRSYLDFCDLETHLMKFILSNQISPCPLVAASLIRKSKQNKTLTNDTFTSILRATSTTNGNDSQELYEPYFSEDRSSYLLSNYSFPSSSPSPPSSSSSTSSSTIFDEIQNKNSDLLIWFQQLLTSQSIIESLPFLKFFSPYEMNFRQNTESLPLDLTTTMTTHQVTEFDFILPKKNEKNKQILTKFSLTFEVQVGQIIIWNFRSFKNDLSFSIELSGEPFLVSKRYASSREEISGVMQIPAMINGKQWSVGTAGGATCICEVKFENKYAGVSNLAFCLCLFLCLSICLFLCLSVSHTHSVPLSIPHTIPL